ncbi:hypothetical protein SUGI_0358000 [Cryptomeria japonica]|nr:hypothetical protein SUGI_0358000 [Cryptomeria japonica]
MMGFREHVGALVGVVMLGIMCCSGMKNTEILVAHNSSGLHWEEMSTSYPAGTLMVGLTLVKGAASTGAGKYSSSSTLCILPFPVYVAVI